MESNSQKEEREKINRLIDNISDDLCVKLTEQACKQYIASNDIDDHFDSYQSWEAFAEKYAKTINQNNNKMQNSQQRKEKRGLWKHKERIIAIAAVLTLFSISPVIASPVKKMLYTFTKDLFVQYNDSITNEDISHKGLYFSFENLPFDVIYPTSNDFVLSRSIEIDSNDNILAAFNVPKYNTEEVLLYINHTNGKIFIEKEETDIQSGIYYGIEFCTTLNNNWQVSAWEYNDYHYALYIPKENADDILSLFTASLHIPVSNEIQKYND